MAGAALGLPAVLHSKWILYGTVYTLAMIVGGAFVLRRHGNSPYQRIRTTSVVTVQVVFAFFLPIVLQVFGRHEYYFSYFWPLKIEYFYPSVILQQPFLIVFWSFLGSLVAFPLLAFFLGKRFYCSWVCGCGGLANTFGELFRHNSTKSARAWSIEKVSIHSVLFLALVTTAIVWVNWAVGNSTRPSPPSRSRSRTGTASRSGRCSRGSSGLASTRSWARGSGAASAARWRRSSASCRSSAASASP